MRYVFSLLLTLAISLSPAWAGEEEGLYDPPPPAGAAYIRNLGPAPVEVGSVNLTGPAYRMIMQGNYDVKGEGLNIKAGERYTLTMVGDKPRLLTDPKLENNARSLLVLYNFSEQPALDLVTADGKLTVVSGVMLNESAGRMVQPIAVELAISSGGKTFATLPGLALQRGASYSIIASGSGEGITARLIQNETAKP